jgi:hypothetical protein
MSLDGPALDLAVRGGLVDLGDGAADAVAACDSAGALVGILKRHGSGRHRLRPNFRGAG